jgi:hypothetical protein
MSNFFTKSTAICVGMISLATATISLPSQANPMTASVVKQQKTEPRFPDIQLSKQQEKRLDGIVNTVIAKFDTILTPPQKQAIDQELKRNPNLIDSLVFSEKPDLKSQQFLVSLKISSKQETQLQKVVDQASQQAMAVLTEKQRQQIFQYEANKNPKPIHSH